MGRVDGSGRGSGSRTAWRLGPQHGRAVVVTGASSGIGAASTVGRVRQGRCGFPGRREDQFAPRLPGGREQRLEDPGGRHPVAAGGADQAVEEQFVPDGVVSVAAQHDDQFSGQSGEIQRRRHGRRRRPCRGCDRRLRLGCRAEQCGEPLGDRTVHRGQFGVQPVRFGGQVAGDHVEGRDGEVGRGVVQADDESVLQAVELGGIGGEPVAHPAEVRPDQLLLRPGQHAAGDLVEGGGVEPFGRVDIAQRVVREARRRQVRSRQQADEFLPVPGQLGDARAGRFQQVQVGLEQAGPPAGAQPAQATGDGGGPVQPSTVDQFGQCGRPVPAGGVPFRSGSILGA
jgi:hypothetical protein